MDPAAILAAIQPDLIQAMRRLSGITSRSVLIGRAAHITNSMHCHTCQRPDTLSTYDLITLAALAALGTSLFPDVPAHEDDP